jgi:hypothetical protein
MYMKKESAQSEFVKGHLHMRPVAYYPIYKDITGSLHGGLMLSQLMYWFRTKSKIYKSRDQLMDELGFTMREYRTARKAISALPFLKMDRQGARGRNYYVIDRKGFASFVIGFIKDNPMIAERYRKQLEDVEDFKAFYSDEKFGIGKPTRDGIDTCTGVESDTCTGDGIDTCTGDGIDTCETQKNDNFDKNTRDGFDTSTRDGFDTSTRDGIDTGTRDGSDTSLTENIKNTIKEYNKRVIGLNDVENEKASRKKPPASSSHSSSEDKPQKDERTSEYTPEFDFAWKLYKVDSSMKGSKKRAFKEFTKTLNFYEDKELIYSAIEKYKTSNAFELRPAQAASFFSGIRNPEHKYYKDYVKGGYEERLELVRAKEAIRMKDNLSSQEMYRKDLSKQGELNAQDLIQRTSKLNLVLNEKFGAEIGIFRFGSREDWIRFTGPDYVAIPIKHPMSKTDKIKVLFHIEELRNNLYVHLHGHLWNEELEKRYNDSNKGFEDIKSIEPPRKEDLDDA